MLKFISSHLLLAAFAIMVWQPAAKAVDLEVSIAPALWSYKETMKTTAGFANTPLSSYVRGMGMLMDMKFQEQFFDRWTVSVTGEVLTSGRAANERWQTPGGSQVNLFSVNHAELRGDFLYRLDELTPLLFRNHEYSPLFSIGGWAAWQDDEQRREGFLINGVRSMAITPAGIAVAEPVRETIQATWVGLSILGDIKNDLLRVRLDIGVPLAVKVVNDVVPGETFTNTEAVRWNLSADIRAYEYENGMTTRVTLAYRYREMGREVRKTALWPTNKWRVVSLGLRQTW